MELSALRMYYKAAVLVPFYTMCLCVIVALLTGVLAELVLRVTTYSGIAGLAASTIFLNRKRSVAFHFIYSLLSFYLLPVIFISFILWTEVDWEGLNTSKGNVVYSSLLFVTFFVHLIGLSISYIDFRRSIVKTIEEEEKEERNQLRTIYDDQIPYA
jgi:hypothetical protein